MNRIGRICRCSRCDGSGKLTGTGRDERPWNQMEDLPLHLKLEKLLGIWKPYACPECSGTGRRRVA